MNGEERRKEILKFIGQSPKPVSGTELAKQFDVSRQVIVQDVALLRAQNQDILSTHRGCRHRCLRHVSFMSAIRIKKFRRS